MYFNIKEPDIVVVLDDSLLKSVNVCSGLKNSLIVNSIGGCLDVRKKYGFNKDVYVIDATKIALEEINMNKSNTAMLGAVAKLAGLKLITLEKYIEKYFITKLGKDLVRRNINAMRRAYESLGECKL